MENIHSFEQKSSSGSQHELGCKNRVIIADRHEPDLKWPHQARTYPVLERVGRLFGAKRRLPAAIKSGDGTRARAGKQTQPHQIPRYSDGIHEQEVEFGPFPSNEWRTSKYTLFDFLPKNLFEQFRRLANFYFLCTAIIQVVLPYSPVGPTTSMVPLIFVVATTAVKQAYEDFLRHRLDKQINRRVCHVLRKKSLVSVKSKDIKVGDFVYVKNNEEIPCDMLLLASSGSGDRCHVTTANLDGETSLKSRSCFNIRTQIGPIETLDDSLLVVECERPNATLYEFNGILRVPKSAHAYHNLLKDIVAKSKSGNSVVNDSVPSSILSLIYKRIRRKHIGLQVRKSIRHPIEGTMDQVTTDTDECLEIPLDITNLLLRASRLRNTSHVYGMAVYTGPDTKLAHNSHVKPNKFSSIESKVNLFLFLAFCLLLTGSLIAAFNYERVDYWYLDGSLTSDSFGQVLLSHFLIYNYLVPISLYVTLEFVKFFGTIAVVRDKSMQATVVRSLSRSAPKSEDDSLGKDDGKNRSGQKRVKMREGAKCNSSDLNEDLGRVEVLFSDKTGTLTENRMQFVACSTYGRLFRSIDSQLYQVPKEIQGDIPIPQIVAKIAAITNNRYAYIAPTASISTSSQGRGKARRVTHFDHHVVPPVAKLKTIQSLSLQRREEIADFFTCLCLCSTITINENKPLAECLPDKMNLAYDYQSASPDEESLISAGSLFGITLIKSSEYECYLAIDRDAFLGGKETKAGPISSGNYSAIVEAKESTPRHLVRHFKRQASFEFDSIRKRMSVIYKDIDNDCLILVAKGSESLLDCIKMSQISAETEQIVNVSLAFFEAFSKSGLRTMLVARKTLVSQEFELIQANVKRARLVQINRAQMLNSVYKKAERNLTLIGTTAVEDSLQDAVPRTIYNLRTAGIKIWLLTGDKVETAISVANLCKLLDRSMTLFYLVRQKDAKSCIEALVRFDKQLRSTPSLTEPPEGLESAGKGGSKERLDHRVSKVHKSLSEGASIKYALIIDGRSLYYALKYNKEMFALLCKQCSCVLGCRLSPLQKAEIVALVKNYPESPITAAIGDGANDVSMIQEAHVGIGIIGKEGRQAVNSSDLAINRFHMLNKLFFVHGHLFYHRTANLIHYFFYKNLLFILPQFIYSFYSLSAGTSLYQPVELICYNLVFTSMPIIVYGLYEVHIPKATLEKHPALYRMNRQNYQLRLEVFLCWLVLAAIQALIAFYWLFFIWGSHNSFLPSGQIAGQGGLSSMLYVSVIFIGLIKLYLLARRHSVLFFFAIALSIILLIATYVVCGLFDVCKFLGDNSLYGYSSEHVRAPAFWIAVLSTTTAAAIPDLIWSFRDKSVKARRVREAINHEQASA